MGLSFSLSLWALKKRMEIRDERASKKSQMNKM